MSVVVINLQETPAYGGGAINDWCYFNNTEAKKRTLAELIDRYIEDVLP